MQSPVPNLEANSVAPLDSSPPHDSPRHAAPRGGPPPLEALEALEPDSPSPAAAVSRAVGLLQQTLACDDSVAATATALLGTACELSGRRRGALAVFDDHGGLTTFATEGFEIESKLLREARGQAAGQLTGGDRLVLPTGPDGDIVLVLEDRRPDAPPANQALPLARALGKLIRSRLRQVQERLRVDGELRQLRYGHSSSAIAVLASARLVPLRAKLKSIARDNSPVLLLGEHGTEKEDLARWLHEAGPNRGESAFVSIYGGIAPDHRLEQELFSCLPVRGQTVFIDSPERLPPGIQDRLAQAMADREVEARLVAASWQTVAELRGGGLRPSFAAQLFSGTRLAIPPLRGHPTDICSLTDVILREMGTTPSGEPRTLTDQAQARLLAFPWPGNVRELRQVLEAGAAEAGGQPISAGHLPADVRQSTGALAQFPTLRDLERRHIAEVTAAVRSKRQAAKVLGIAPSTLYEKLHRYEIE